MPNGGLNWIARFIWNIADGVLRDVYVRGKYRDVILPMTVIHRHFFLYRALPHVPDAWIDESKTQIGYEISFTRHFYKPTTNEDARRDKGRSRNLAEGS